VVYWRLAAAAPAPLTSPAAEQDDSQGNNDTVWMCSLKAALHCMLLLPSFAS
jgi:hypothetical protein